MAYEQKDLTVLNSFIETKIPQDHGSATASIQYISGTGTLIMQVSDDGVTFATRSMVPAGGGAEVLLLTAVGQAHADVSGYRVIRCTKSVGGAACVGGLSLNHR